MSRRRLTDAKPPTAAEERELVARMRAGDVAARDRLVEGHMGLVARIAAYYAPQGQARGLDFDDLVAEGAAGLVRSLGRFDPARGLRVMTYMGHWVRQSIRRALDDGGMVRVPVHARLGGERREKYAAEAERAESCGSLGEVKALGLADPGDGPAERAAAAEARDDLRRRLARLEPADRAFVEELYGLDGGPGRTLKEMGDRLGVGRERARQIELECLAALRDGTTRRAAVAAGRVLGTLRGRAAGAGRGRRWCPDCGRERPVGEFGPNAARRDGLSRYCRAHASARSMQSRRAGDGRKAVGA